MTSKHPSTTHYEHNQLVLLGDIATSLERVASSLDRLADRQAVMANALLRLSDEHGSKAAGPFP